MRKLFWAASLPAFVACGLAASSQPDNPAPKSAPPIANAVRFIAFGDAGRGDDAQYAVAAAMTQLCALKGCDFAVELGDNIYNGGVDSVTDPAWQSKFEKPYQALNIPFYPAIGNHDDAASSIGPGSGTNHARGAVQVAYTGASNSSGKWRLPARYHAFTVPFTLKAGERPIAELLVLDSNPLAATQPDPINSEYQHQRYGSQQLQWLQAALKNSTAHWTIAYAHHPYIGNGLHGDAGRFDGVAADKEGTANGKPWRAFFEAGVCQSSVGNGTETGVDFFLFGHDHDLEWLQPTASCNSKTEFIMSGGGSTPRSFGDADRHPAYWQQDQRSGFFWFELTATSFKGEAYPLRNGKLPVDAEGSPIPAFTRQRSKP